VEARESLELTAAGKRKCVGEETSFQGGREKGKCLQASANAREENRGFNACAEAYQLQEKGVSKSCRGHDLSKGRGVVRFAPHAKTLGSRSENISDEERKRRVAVMGNLQPQKKEKLSVSGKIMPGEGPILHLRKRKEKLSERRLSFSWFGKPIPQDFVSKKRRIIHRKGGFHQTANTGQRKGTLWLCGKGDERTAAPKKTGKGVEI